MFQSVALKSVVISVFPPPTLSLRVVEPLYVVAAPLQTTQSLSPADGDLPSPTGHPDDNRRESVKFSDTALPAGAILQDDRARTAEPE